MKRPGFAAWTVHASLIGLIACGRSFTGPSPALGADFTLAPGDRVRVSGTSISLQFDRVDGDSRCPVDVVCVQGGDALVRITVRDEGTDRRYELHTGSLQPVKHARLAVVLVDLTPYPFSTRTIAPAEYRATFRVT